MRRGQKGVACACSVDMIHIPCFLKGSSVRTVYPGGGVFSSGFGRERWPNCIVANTEPDASPDDDAGTDFTAGAVFPRTKVVLGIEAVESTNDTNLYASLSAFSMVHTSNGMAIRSKEDFVLKAASIEMSELNTRDGTLIVNHRFHSSTSGRRMSSCR